MLAKGRLLGVQFEEMLKDGLYMELSRHAIGLAMRLGEGFENVDSPESVAEAALALRKGGGQDA